MNLFRSFTQLIGFGARHVVHPDCGNECYVAMEVGLRPRGPRSGMQASTCGTRPVLAAFRIRFPSEASCHSSGWESRQQRSPVAVVVISSNRKDNRSVGSLEVKAPVAKHIGPIRTRG